MSSAALLADVSRFVGHHVINCIDEIEAAAKLARYSVNVLDPDYNTGSINSDLSRLNVRTDRDGKIISFSIG